MKLVLVDDSGIHTEYSRQSYGHVHIDPGDGTLYCIADRYQRVVGQHGYRHSYIANYITMRTLLENGRTDEAEALFYAAKIRGEV